ncbi:MAG: acyl-CoA dehydrogenase family protein [Polyangiaceae bacterium]|nr:acyl-CoA dehydrogenase family protein [Polyangiaceae bacterium]
MAFFQTPPTLGNQFDDDRVLQAYLGSALPGDVLSKVREDLRELGDLSGDRLYRLQLEDRLNEPKLTQWDPWGNRVDTIEVTPLWKEAARIACEQGVVATAYERAFAEYSRIVQFAKVYLFDASTDVYTCPLAMTDGAAKTLLVHGHEPMSSRAIARLASRDPKTAWTSGQWMTERTGGSDVGLSETEARLCASDNADVTDEWPPRKPGTPVYTLHGTKWFTSAITSQMALTLGRPVGNPPGGRGLALFYLEIDKPNGRRNGILVNRLKDKLGTRKVPTAELTLDGVLAVPVVGTSDGVRAITPMLNITRTWNSVAAVSAMRRGLALARDYAKRRVQFGATLSNKALHLATLADMQAEFEGAFALAFRVVGMLGREEAGVLTESETKLLRLLTPVMKLTTGKQAVAVLSEVLECFGGAGYVEDTGLPRLYRDAQVLPIWEGTTNVLSLDTLRAIGKEGGLNELLAEVKRAAESCTDADLVRVSRAAVNTMERAAEWLSRSYGADPMGVEGAARGFALTLGRSTEVALLARAAQKSLDRDGDPRPRAAALGLFARGIDLVRDDDREASAMLANDIR